MIISPETAQGNALQRFELFLTTQKRFSLNTITAYLTDLRQYEAFLHEHERTLETARNKEVKDFLAQCYENNIGPRARARKLSSIKALYNWAQQILGWSNPALTVPYPKIQKRLPRFLTEYQIELLLQTAQKDSSPLGVRNKIILYLLYTSGMRITELTQLRVANIDFKSEFLIVNGKGGKQRSVPLPPLMLSLLHDYAHNTIAQLIELTPQLQQSGKLWLFPVLYKGVIKPISRQSCWLLLRELCVAAGINRPVSPHLLRHSLATHLLQKGANIRALQVLLGHESINTVHIYTHLQTDHLRFVYNKKHPRA